MEQWRAVEALLEAAIQCPEVRAVFIKGSLAYGTADEYSDVDFYCLVDDCEVDSFLPKRLALLERYRPLLYTSTANYVGPQVIAVFDNGLHFDLYTVTLSTFPLVGSFKVLHDPENILAALNPLLKDHSTSMGQVAESFSEFSFTLLEFLAAWRRQDLVWSYRLASHLVGNLGLVLRYRFDHSNSLLGLKRLEKVLPKQLKERLRRAIAECHGVRLPQGVAELCLIMEGVAIELEQKNKLDLSWPLFRLMQTQVFALTDDLV